MIGSCYAFFYYIEDIMLKSRKIKSAWNTYHSTVVFTQTVTALVVGLISYFLRKAVNEYILGIIGALIGILGFLLCIFADAFEPRLFTFGVLFIAIAAGFWWIMPALIAYDDAGPPSFAVLLSLIFVANYWGMATFGITFEVFFYNLDNPLITTFVVFIVACVCAIIA